MSVIKRTKQRIKERIMAKLRQWDRLHPEGIQGQIEGQCRQLLQNQETMLEDRAVILDNQGKIDEAQTYMRKFQLESEEWRLESGEWRLNVSEHLQNIEILQNARYAEFQAYVEKTDRLFEAVADSNAGFQSNNLIRNHMRTQQEKDVFNKMTYSQAGEDAICMYVAAVIGKPLHACTYLDLGANRAKNMSNTYNLYKKGAHGVLVDANPEMIKELRLVRPRDITLHRCVAPESGKKQVFYRLNADGLSTTSPEAVSEFIEKNSDVRVEEELVVETISVGDLIEEYFQTPPFLLNVDIEGQEMAILQTFPFEKCRPFLIIVEMIPYNPALIVGEKNEEIGAFMKTVGYEEYAYTGINSIFIDKKRIAEIYPHLYG